VFTDGFLCSFLYGYYSRGVIISSESLQIPEVSMTAE